MILCKLIDLIHRTLILTKITKFRDRHLLTFLSLRNNFPPDYMHVLCLGVCKRLLNTYFTTSFGRFLCFLPSSAKSWLEERVNVHKGALTSEFQRKIRSFSQLQYFKATEFRSIMLYTGPYLFKNILSNDYYDHFLLLHLYIFVSNNHQNLLPQAKACVDKFLYKLPFLFDESACTYNCHIFSHLAEFVERNGNVCLLYTSPSPRD